MVSLHANTVTKNSATGVRTGGINGHNADRLPPSAIFAGKLVNQRALACAWRAGNANYPRLAAVREKSLQQFNGFRPAVFNDADGARQGTNFAFADALHPNFDCGLIARVANSSAQDIRSLRIWFSNDPMTGWPDSP